jgi:hypothetical protein
MSERDRNGVLIEEGSLVRLTPGMSVGRVRRARVTRIDGGDVYVRCNLGAAGGLVEAHRYGCEMEVIS